MSTLRCPDLNSDLKSRQVATYARLLDRHPITVGIPFDANSQEMSAIAADTSLLLTSCTPEFHFIIVANARRHEHPGDDDEFNAYDAWLLDRYSRAALLLLDALHQNGVRADIQPPLNADLDTFGYHLRHIDSLHAPVGYPGDLVRIWTPIVHTRSNHNALRAASSWDVMTHLAEALEAIKLVVYIPDEHPLSVRNGPDSSVLDTNETQALLATLEKTPASSLPPLLEDASEVVTPAYLAHAVRAAMDFVMQGGPRRGHLISSQHEHALSIELLTLHGDGTLIKSAR